MTKYLVGGCSYLTISTYQGRGSRIKERMERSKFQIKNALTGLVTLGYDIREKIYMGILFEYSEGGPNGLFSFRVANRCGIRFCGLSCAQLHQNEAGMK